MLPGQVMEEMTEAQYIDKWNYAFSDDVLGTFKKRYGAIAYHDKLFSARSFVISRTRRYVDQIEAKHKVDLQKLEEDERNLAEVKTYSYIWKTDVALNIRGMETYAKQLRDAAEKSLIQRYLTLSKSYVNYLKTVNDPNFKENTSHKVIGQLRPLGFFLTKVLCAGYRE